MTVFADTSLPLFLKCNQKLKANQELNRVVIQFKDQGLRIDNAIQ